MGTGASQAESSGGSTGSAGAPVSRHAGAAGKSSGGLIGSERGRNEKEKDRVKTRTLQKSKHAAPGTERGLISRNLPATEFCRMPACRAVLNVMKRLAPAILLCLL